MQSVFYHSGVLSNRCFAIEIIVFNLVSLLLLFNREADRAILTACQQKGANKITFEAVSAQLGNKTANEVRERSVASLYRVAATE